MENVDNITRSEIGMKWMLWKTWVLALCFAGIASAGGPLDETWTVTVAGQSVQANADGSFIVANISSPDLFGTDGPGSPPDFLSDDFVRLTGVSEDQGTTCYVFSEAFQIISGQTFLIGDLTFTDVPPLTNHSLSAVADDPVLTEIDQTTQLTVTALLSDGSSVDVTLFESRTIYRASNLSIVDVSKDGLVTAKAAGQAYITASNEGAASVVGIVVSPGDPLTTVEGFVRLEDGTPVEGAVVRIFDQFETAITDATGHYEITQVATTFGALEVKALGSIDGILFAGSTLGIEPFIGGITDAGIITVVNVGEDLDNDLMPDELEPDLGLDPTDPDTDGDGIIDGLEDSDLDGLINCEEVALGTDPGNPDTDGDLLEDGPELDLGTDPFDVDTDDDGFIDGEEVEFASDPLDPDSLPVDPTLSLGEGFGLAVSVENAALPVPNIPTLEAIGPVFSVENEALP